MKSLQKVSLYDNCRIFIWKHSFHFMFIAWFSILENMHFFSFTFNCISLKMSPSNWGTFTVFHYKWCIRLRYIQHIITSSFLFHFVSFFNSHWIGSFNTTRRSVTLRCIKYLLNISLVFSVLFAIICDNVVLLEKSFANRRK